MNKWQLGIVLTSAKRDSHSAQYTLRLIALCISGALVASSGDCTKAQNITLDGSLGSAQTLTGPNYIIPQNLGQSVGSNLFHSFWQFNLDTGETAGFQSTADIQNILSRVTGGSASLIDGLIYTDSPSVNLFLINPSGIVFGSNASIDVGSTTRGSFVATTANAIWFASQGAFVASAAQTDVTLLTVNPSAFLFNQITAAPVSSQASLQVNEGQSLLIVGGEVSLNGSALKAPGGRVELGGVAGEGTIELKIDGHNLRLSFPDRVARADVSLFNGSQLDVIGGNGGSIAINARNLKILGGIELRAGIESVGEQGGDITLDAQEAMTIANSSTISNDVGPDAEGDTGGIYIRAGSLSLTNGTTVRTSAFGRGETTGVFVQANNSVSIANGAIIAKTGQTGAGNGGNINIQAEAISLTEDSLLETSTSRQGHAGNLIIDARDTVSVDNSLLSSETFGLGNGGIIDMEARTLFLTDGAQLSSATFGEGKGGKIQINASESINISGVNSRGGFSSGLISSSEGQDSGQGGDINVTTDSLRLSTGAVLNTRTRSAFGGGSITVNTNTLELTRGGQLLASTFNSGSAGEIIVNAIDSVTISGSDPTFDNRLVQFGRGIVDNDGTNSGLFTRSSSNSADAGNITIEAPSIRLDNGATINAETVGGQGNIKLDSVDLVLRRGSNITTNATGTNNIGGNITIDTSVLAALEDSDIRADSANARGGNITITAQGIFGTKFREEPTPESDITATGANSSLLGTVTLNTPDIDPSQGVANLPTEVVDASNQIDQTCAAGRGETGKNEFIIIGRGGLPSNPYEMLSPDDVWEDVRPPSGFSSRRNSQPDAARIVTPQPTTGNPKQQLVEAQGWGINDKGQVILTATASIATLHNSGLGSATCPSS